MIASLLQLAGLAGVVVGLALIAGIGGVVLGGAGACIFVGLALEARS